MLYEKGAKLVDLGVPVQHLSRLPIISQIKRLKSQFRSEQVDEINEFRNEINKITGNIQAEYEASSSRQVSA